MARRGVLLEAWVEEDQRGPREKKGREGKLRRLTRKSAGGRRGAEGGWQGDKCAAWSQFKVGPGSGLGRGMCRAG